MMQKFQENVKAFAQCRVAVIGDLMLDEYLWGQIERISPEAPVPVLSLMRRDFTLGGAGNVAENLCALGVQVTVFGVVGQDQTGEHVRHLLNHHGIDCRGVIVEPSRTSTRKTRMMSLEHGQQVFRLDDESAFDISQDVEDRLIAMVGETLNEVQAILFSDYSKGVLTARLLGLIFASARQKNIPCVVAPKDSNAKKYCGATVLVPNARELGQLVGRKVDGDSWLSESARQLVQALDLEAVVVTRGREGMSLFQREGTALRRVDVATTARSVYDVTGAGDTAIAVFGACLATGCGYEKAVQLANWASGIKVGKRGTACVSAEELANSFKPDSSEPTPPEAFLEPSLVARQHSSPSNGNGSLAKKSPQQFRA